MNNRLTSEQRLPFACFTCRIVVKDKALLYSKQARQPQVVCSRCGGLTLFMGRYFKAPPRRAIAQWRKAEMLWRAGWKADGRSSRGLCVKTPRDARSYQQQIIEREQLRSEFLRRKQSQTSWSRARQRRRA